MSVPSGDEDHGRALLHLAVIVLGSGLGLIYPLMFLTAHFDLIDQLPTIQIPFGFFVVPITGPVLYASTWIIMGAGLAAHFWAAGGGEFLRKLPEKGIQWFITAWNTFNLLLAAALIYVTGGIHASTFGWLFEYVLVVMLVIRPTHKGTGLTGMARWIRHWGPVVITGLFELVLIYELIVLGLQHRQPSFSGGGPFWSGFSLLAALLFTALLFGVNEMLKGEGVKLKPANRDMAAVHAAVVELQRLMTQVIEALRKANLIEDGPPAASSTPSKLD